ncbi:hypothetical protein BASA62_005301 [Batrachochytrium salamandrivorans]|nr:hypothetical protein BASA62_005301 [Batrachochytrium salamandrivorans]
MIWYATELESICSVGSVDLWVNTKSVHLHSDILDSILTKASNCNSKHVYLPMASQQRATRMQREIAMLQSPPPGITAWAEEGSLYRLSAVIRGLADSPYADGLFKLEIQIPQRFPFEPPCIRFITPIYHPNIDDHGRICLDILKMPPKGSWRPSIHISGVLNSIRLLLLEPNPDDPLSDDIAIEFKMSRLLFISKAREYTKCHATGSPALPVAPSQVDQVADSTLLGDQMKSTNTLDVGLVKTDPSPNGPAQQSRIQTSVVPIEEQGIPEKEAPIPIKSNLAPTISTLHAAKPEKLDGTILSNSAPLLETSEVNPPVKRAFKSLKAGKGRKVPR